LTLWAKNQPKGELLMATFLRPSKRVTRVTYDRHFEYADTPGAGFGFPCDEQGNLGDEDGALSELALANYAACLAGEINGYKMIDCGIRRFENIYTEPAMIECVDCQRVVILAYDAVHCECGRYYNLSGQALSDPSNWGEETGETAADILGPGGYDDEG
jgi:hypothetical protein